MLLERAGRGFLGLVRFVAPRTKEIAPEEQELPRVGIGKLPEAEEFFIVLINAIFPQNLSRENPVYHNANGFSFKIYPVGPNNTNGTYSLLAERKRNQTDVMPIDSIEIVRNPKDPKDPALTDFSYRQAVTKKGVTSWVSLKGETAISKVKAFLAAMVLPLETGSNPASL